MKSKFNLELGPIVSSMWRTKTGVILIASQIALTLAILANAAFIVRDRIIAARKTSGVDESHVFMISTLSYNGKGDHLAQQKIDESLLRAIPGVRFTTAVNQMPLSSSGSNTGFSRNREQKDTTMVAAYYQASSSLIDTFGLKLIEGGDFSPLAYQDVDPEVEDKPSDDAVALISKSFGKRMFPELEQFVNQIFYVGTGSGARPIRVIGTYEALSSPWGRVNWNGRTDDGEATVILPRRVKQPFSIIAVRVDDSKIESVMNEAEKVLLAATPGRVVVQKSSMTELRQERYRGDYFLVGLLLAVMVLLILMTTAGIVGLASLWVNQRRKQIGVRRALGATRSDILRYFLVENFLMTSIGALFGIGLALMLNKALMGAIAMERLPLSYIVIGIFAVITIGLIAVLNPALKAASVTPAEATRSV